MGFTAHKVNLEVSRKNIYFHSSVFTLIDLLGMLCKLKIIYYATKHVFAKIL